jgi:hypothetical protein
MVLPEKSREEKQWRWSSTISSSNDGKRQFLSTQIGKFPLIIHQSWLRLVRYSFKSHATQQPNVHPNWGNVPATVLMTQYFLPCHLFPFLGYQVHPGKPQFMSIASLPRTGN